MNKDNDDLTTKEKHGLFESMVTNIPGVIYRCLPFHPWTMLFVSDEIENLLGHNVEDFLGVDSKLRFGEFMHPDDIDRISKNTQNAIDTHTSYVNEYRMIDKYGETKWVYARGKAVYDEANQPKYLDGAIFDISAREKATQALSIAKREAEQADLAKSMFLANMSHEIRTPMNAILGFAELLSNHQLDDTSHQYVKLIQKAGDSLLTLINDVLDLSKVEAGKLELNNANTDLSVLIDDVVKLLSNTAKEKGLNLSIQIEENAPRYVVIDENRLKQVLINLVNNAIKFTQEGFINLRVSCNRKKRLIIEVQDSGSGIDTIDQERIFNNFEQIENIQKTNASGTGLGLAIAKKMVKLMGGNISVKSEVGKGSCFSVSFKNIVECSPEKVDVKKAVVNAENFDFENATLLIADDVEDNINLLCAYFKPFPFKILIANNGQELIDIAIDHIPDLIIADVKMPVLDGLTAVSKLKQLKKTAKIPCVAFTASALKDEKEIILDIFDGYLAKPVQRAGLFEEVSKYISFKQKQTLEQHTATKSVVTEANVFVQTLLDDIHDLRQQPGDILLMRKIQQELKQLHATGKLPIDEDIIFSYSAKVSSFKSAEALEVLDIIEQQLK